MTNGVLQAIFPTGTNKICVFTSQPLCEASVDEDVKIDKEKAWTTCIQSHVSDLRVGMLHVATIASVGGDSSEVGDTPPRLRYMYA